MTVVNHGLITGDGVTGDGDGIDVDGLVNITNTGTVHSLNAVGSASEGLSVGGGTILNSGTIEGSVAPGNTTATGRGITLTGNDLPGGGREPIYDNATVTNQAGGLIRGDTDFGHRRGRRRGVRSHGDDQQRRRRDHKGRRNNRRSDRRQRELRSCDDHERWSHRRLEQRQSDHSQPKCQ